MRSSRTGSRGQGCVKRRPKLGFGQWVLRRLWFPTFATERSREDGARKVIRSLDVEWSFQEDVTVGARASVVSHLRDRPPQRRRPVAGDPGSREDGARKVIRSLEVEW